MQSEMVVDYRLLVALNKCREYPAPVIRRNLSLTIALLATALRYALNVLFMESIKDMMFRLSERLYLRYLIILKLYCIKFLKKLKICRFKVIELMVKKERFKKVIKC